MDSYPIFVVEGRTQFCTSGNFFNQVGAEFRNAGNGSDAWIRYDAKYYCLLAMKCNGCGTQTKWHHGVAKSSGPSQKKYNVIASEVRVSAEQSHHFTVLTAPFRIFCIPRKSSDDAAWSGGRLSSFDNLRARLHRGQSHQRSLVLILSWNYGWILLCLFAQKTNRLCL